MAKIKLGKQKRLSLGNVEAVRDWGYTPDYVQGMTALLKLDHADDVVMCTGAPHSVMEFAEEAFRVAGMGAAADYIDIDEARKRPLDIDVLTGNPAKAKSLLGWQARTKFEELVRIMVDADIELQKATT